MLHSTVKINRVKSSHVTVVIDDSFLGRALIVDTKVFVLLDVCLDAHVGSRSCVGHGRCYCSRCCVAVDNFGTPHASTLPHCTGRYRLLYGVIHCLTVLYEVRMAENVGFLEIE
jgi:hypothetical protein